MKLISVNVGMHAGGISYMEDGNVLCHYEEERYSRIKNGMNFHNDFVAFPYFAINRFIQQFNPDFSTIDAVLWNDYPTARELINVIPVPLDRWFRLGHYLSHAASAYYQSGFDDPTLVITLDGAGTNENGDCKLGEYFLGENGKLTSLGGLDGPGMASFGTFYAAVTELIGFKRMKDEGKITGMAAHGEKVPQIYDAINKNFSVDGIHTKAHGDHPQFLQLFVDVINCFGNGSWKGDNLSVHVAYAAQLILEEKATQLIRNVHALVPHVRKLALAGGIFANVALNRVLNSLPDFDEIFIAPQMGDEGLTVGNLLAYSGRLGLQQPRRLENVYLGTMPTKQEEDEAFSDPQLDYTWYSPQSVAKLLHNGKTVGIFQGASESGPRALGNRSIIANPTNANVVNKLTNVLRRNKFMPFAPTVLAEQANNVFHVDKSAYTAEFMTMCYNTRKEWVDRIPAVIHPIDKTARPQILRRQTNPVFHDIISEFHKLSGIPLVLNTSFNVHDEPIIDLPIHAINHLKNRVIDFLVYPPYIISRGL